MDKKVRMADIAQELGVSVVSVSKALAGQPGVSEETREKVLELARKMGYVPLRTKPAASRGNASGNIGVLVADRFFADNTFYSTLYRQVLMRSNENGFSVLLELVSREAERTGTLPAMLQGNKVDGVIFMGEIDRDYLLAIARSGVPYMLLDFYDEELDADSVTSDNVAGGCRLTGHLLQTGRRNIGFVGSVHATSSILDRYLGYTKALMRANIPVRSDWVLEDRAPTGLLKPVELPEEMPEAFLCNCDEVAFNLVEQLKRRGYRVPEDVAVAGYDDFYFSQVSTPPLTTYRVNVEEMGRIVVTHMIRKIRGKRVAKGNVVVAGQLIPRESTARKK